ncbi:acetylxylan esterase [Pseudonocardia sp. DSM 110487]|uniref:acetylxylan esterase n=1 Tax=Pseudonocardia sp. DSM 110487 TaxID=2865833 RepID=UPI001C695979|nr:acetylxylan esterase [Pseudonocardia sp. DSM 110487]QYN32261.1 acetylxylan esterase [Pseudonocardia sp. DSM 110487]
MARADLPLDELVSYRPVVSEPDDFDAFWSRTLDETRTHDLDVRSEEVDTPYRTVTVRDVTFSGFGGDRIGAWFTTPRTAGDDSLPAVVEFIGYNGGRDLPGESLRWASAGYAHLLVDTRGQGARWGGGGRTADPHGSGPATPGFMTRGIDRPDTYFYRRVFTDAVRAVEAVRTLPGVDAGRVAVQGGSQGGGITLAVAGLVPGLVAALPDVPFLCHFTRALDICDKDPYAEVTRYLAVHRHRVDDVLRTLSYFDGVNFAKRAAAPALFSVALMDLICPPSTVYAAFNNYGANHHTVDKEIEVYRYNDHEGGESYQRQAQIRWLDKLLGR